MNARERALHRALTLWHANDNLHAVEAMEAVTAQVAARPLHREARGVPLLRAWPAIHGAAISRAHDPSRTRCTRTTRIFLRWRPSPASCATTTPRPRPAPNARSASSRETRGRSTPSPTSSSGKAGCTEGLARMEAFLPLLATCGRPIHSHDAWHLALLHLEQLDVPAAMRVFHATISGASPRISWSSSSTRSRCFGASRWPARRWMRNGRRSPIMSRRRATETFMPFMNAHYLYALARAGRRRRGGGGTRQRAQRAAKQMTRKQSACGPRSGRAVVEAAAAFGAGDRARAAATARSGHADDDVDRRQRCPGRPVSPGLSAQPAGRWPARRCRGVFRAHHRRQSAARRSTVRWRIDRAPRSRISHPPRKHNARLHETGIGSMGPA